MQTGAPTKVQWTKDRKTLGPVVTRIGTANVTHVIPSVASKDQGPYSCFASNVGGTATAVTTLVVKGRKTLQGTLLNSVNRLLKSGIRIDDEGPLSRKNTHNTPLLMPL